LRLLHCIYTLGGGGAERQLAYLATRTAELGNEVHVAYFRSGPNLKYFDNSRVVLHALPARYKYDPRMLLDVYRLIRRVKPQIVQTWLTQMDILAGMVAWWSDIPVVLSERASGMAYPRGLRNMLRDLAGRQAVTIVANSRHGCEYWRGKQVKGNLKVIRNGIPVNQIAATEPCSVLPVGTGIALDSTDRLVLFAGRYEWQKNPYVLLAALSRALAECTNAVAVMFGTGPLGDSLHSALDKLPNSDRIHILGYTDKLWNYMRRADLLVSVSLFEGHPNVVLEAAAAGCALVLSDIPEHREIFEQDSVCMVPPQDEKRIAEAIVRLLEKRETASDHALRAREQIQQWSIDRAVQEFSDLYNKILA